MTSPLLPAEGLDPALQEKLRALADPATYREPVGRIETIETHCAWVFLTDAHAFKLKKPIRLDRMDNLLLSSRHYSCLEELRLNRRLAPDVYLEVVSLNVNESGVFSLGGGGVPVEWLVKMRRLPSELMLDHAIAAATVTASALRGAAELLAEFYVGQASINMSANAYLERMARQIETNHAALLAADLGLSVQIVSAIISRQQEFLQRRSSLFIERAQLGKIIEAHGDLKPEHVYLGKPPCVIDCLEFDRDLRLLDPVEELAFFSMECQRLGEAWIGREVTRIYAVVSGDRFEQSLFDFYLSRRATQRAVTAAWHLRDHALKRSTDWRARATAYLNDALRMLHGLGIGIETAKL
jgi:aminoglycoside phosphotransferase family enzyme